MRASDPLGNSLPRDGNLGVNQINGLMSPEEKALLEACRARPADDLPRLVLADWYDERCDLPGDPGWPPLASGQSARAQFIRVQCQAAAPDTDSAEQPLLLREAASLLARHRRDWEQPLRNELGAVTVRYKRGLPVAVTLARNDRPLPSLRELAPTVTTLCIDHPTDQDVQWLAGCRHLAEIQKLNLNGGGLSVAGVQALSGSPYNSGLRTLSLAGNNLGMQSIRALMASPLAGRLTALDLSSNPIGSYGMLALTRGPELHGLKRLRLKNVDVARGHLHLSYLARSDILAPEARIELDGFTGSFSDFQKHVRLDVPDLRR
jgi:uncharacterized protein (TIGR02996 family)